MLIRKGAFLQYIFIVFFIFFTSACTLKNGLLVQEVQDLKTIPQNVKSYTAGIDEGYISTIAQYRKKYFAIWNKKDINSSHADVMWAYRVFTPKNSYGENLQHIKQDFFDKMLENSHFQNYGTLNRPALTLRAVNLRTFPSKKPLFLDPKRAGEGFPFDYLQNSSIGPNKPVVVSHYSKDKAWVYILSSFASGWVDSRDIVFIPEKEKNIWQEAQQVVYTKDNVPLFDEKGNFLFYSRIGTMAPLIDVNQSSNRVLTVNKNSNSQIYFHASKLSSEVSHKGLLQFNTKNINEIIEALQKMNYGWGGMYGQRDCSSTMRDFFAPFGIWLPRNSAEQSKVGKVISLKGLSNKQKIQRIKQEAIPFQTLLYKRGHIVLYVGIKNEKVVIFQNVWGVKTLQNHKAGRHIIGRTIFSTLEVGKNLYYYDPSASLLTHLESMNIVTD